MTHHSDAGSQGGYTRSDRRAVEWQVGRCVHWYNHQRLHSSIGDLPPLEFEHPPAGSTRDPDPGRRVTNQPSGKLRTFTGCRGLIKSEADIETLRKDAVETTHRAGVTEGRADGDRRRIEALEARAAMDREMLDELRAEGVLKRDHAANLELALQSARVIGTAVGMVMAKCTVSEMVSFETLKATSQDTNRRLRAVAEEIVSTGDVSQLRRGAKGA